MMNWSDLYKRAYELAFLVITEPSVARSVARISLAQLETALEQQYRRGYYRLRRFSSAELREEDILDPTGLALSIIDGDDSISTYLKDKGFLKPSTVDALMARKESPNLKQFLRQKITDNLNDAILRGNLPGASSAIKSEPFADEKRMMRQRQNRLLIQQAYGRHLASGQHRNFVNLSDEQTLQLLVYIAVENYELLNETAGEVMYEDLCVRYLKYLAKISFRANSFYTAVAYGSLIYDYGRAGSKKIYEYALQDESRFKPESNYSNLKARIIKDLELKRFSGNYNLVKVESPGANTNFRRNSLEFNQKAEILSWLRKLSLWRKCLNAEINNLKSETLDGLFLFSGIQADDEHLFERRRIHAISCPNCLALISQDAGIENPADNFKMPVFESSTTISRNGKGGYRNAPALEQIDIDNDLKELQGMRALRRTMMPSHLSIRVDGFEWLRIASSGSLTETNIVAVNTPYEIVEVWGNDELHADVDILIATKFFDTDFVSEKSEVISVNLFQHGALMLEFIYTEDNEVALTAYWSLTEAQYESFPNLENCIGYERLCEISLKKSTELIFETNHLRVCQNCDRLRLQIEQAIHPNVSTLLAYKIGTLAVDSAKEIESHLGECELCPRVLRAESIKTVAQAAQAAARDVLDTAHRFFDSFAAAIESVSLPVAFYKGVNTDSEIPFFKLIDQRQVTLNVEETDEGDWLATAAASDPEFEGKKYYIELIGDVDNLFEQIIFRKRGDYYEGSVYFSIDDKFREQNRTVLILGCLHSTEFGSYSLTDFSISGGEGAKL